MSRHGHQKLLTVNALIEALKTIVELNALNFKVLTLTLYVLTFEINPDHATRIRIRIKVNRFCLPGHRPHTYSKTTVVLMELKVEIRSWGGACGVVLGLVVSVPAS